MTKVNKNPLTTLLALGSVAGVFITYKVRAEIISTSVQEGLVSGETLCASVSSTGEITLSTNVAGETVPPTMRTYAAIVSAGSGACDLSVEVKDKDGIVNPFSADFCLSSDGRLLLASAFDAADSDLSLMAPSPAEDRRICLTPDDQQMIDEARQQDKVYSSGVLVKMGILPHGAEVFAEGTQTIMIDLARSEQDAP